MAGLNRILVSFFYLLCLCTTMLGQDSRQVVYLHRAHAHNDYHQKRPLLDALDHGFCSVEADVFLHGDKLLVAHTIFELKRERTLSKLYLDPLFARIQKHGWVHAKQDNFTLLIDFKSNASKCLDSLNTALKPHRQHLTRLENGKLIPGAITIVISGSRPTKRIVEEQDRFVFLDGRLGDPVSWGKEVSPLISESWSSHFQFRGLGEMGPDEMEKLNSIVSRVHSQGKRVRFWALPDRETGWQAAYDCGVDLINTDKLGDLRSFLLKKQ